MCRILTDRSRKKSPSPIAQAAPRAPNGNQHGLRQQFRVFTGNLKSRPVPHDTQEGYGSPISRNALRSTQRNVPRPGYVQYRPEHFPLLGAWLAATIEELSEIKTLSERLSHHFQMEWQSIATAPFDRDLQLAVIDAGEIHMLVFPCRRVLRGWIKSTTNEPVLVRPTHWREWKDAASPPSSASAGQPASVLPLPTRSR